MRLVQQCAVYQLLHTELGGLPTQHLLLGRCQHWVSTPTKGDTALEGVDTYQRRYCLARCQHLARQYLLW